MGEYICESCKGQFSCDITEEEKQAEYDELYPSGPSKKATVCNDCFNFFSDKKMTYETIKKKWETERDEDYTMADLLTGEGVDEAFRILFEKIESQRKAQSEGDFFLVSKSHLDQLEAIAILHGQGQCTVEVLRDARQESRAVAVAKGHAPVLQWLAEKDKGHKLPYD